MESDEPRELDQLKLHHLRFLVKLFKLGHLERAAKAMAVTQSAASKLLSEQKHRFARPLFDQGRFGVHLLPATFLKVAPGQVPEATLPFSALPSVEDKRQEIAWP